MTPTPPPTSPWEEVHSVKVSSRSGTQALIESTHRLQVPGGWLVRIETENGVTSLYYPDPTYAWAIAPR